MIKQILTCDRETSQQLGRRLLQKSNCQRKESLKQSPARTAGRCEQLRRTFINFFMVNDLRSSC